MSIRKQVARNVGILSLLMLSFILGIFAAEAIGTLLDRSTAAEPTADGSEAAGSAPVAPTPASNLTGQPPLNPAP